jgi:hypothetical protein
METYLDSGVGPVLEKLKIDIVAIDDLGKRILIAEVKRQSKKFNSNQLLLKSAHLLTKLNLKNYAIDQRCFSLDNLEDVMTEFSVK